MTEPPQPPDVCDRDHCITCGYDGVPMTVARLDPASGLAECVDSSGRRTDVETALLAAVRAGDRVLVHAGVAIAALTGQAGG
ncbi:MAG: HypC/HybG/HupF family hydrogenase formation chaperone [Gaiellales bacterium]